jgi:hypothetical protein
LKIFPIFWWRKQQIWIWTKILEMSLEECTHTLELQGVVIQCFSHHIMPQFTSLVWLYIHWLTCFVNYESTALYNHWKESIGSESCFWFFYWTHVQLPIIRFLRVWNNTFLCSNFSVGEGFSMWNKGWSFLTWVEQQLWQQGLLSLSMLWCCFGFVSLTLALMFGRTIGSFACESFRHCCCFLKL